MLNNASCKTWVKFVLYLFIALITILIMSSNIVIRYTIITWCVSQGLKMIIKKIKHKKLDISAYGGMPSSHTTMVTAGLTCLCCETGLSSYPVAVMYILFIITILDANHLRLPVGLHAKILNEIYTTNKKLDENIGHTEDEILVGILIGIIIPLILYNFF